MSTVMHVPNTEIVILKFEDSCSHLESNFKSGIVLYIVHVKTLFKLILNLTTEHIGQPEDSIGQPDVNREAIVDIGKKRK